MNELFDGYTYEGDLKEYKDRFSKVKSLYQELSDKLIVYDPLERMIVDQHGEVISLTKDELEAAIANM